MSTAKVDDLEDREQREAERAQALAAWHGAYLALPLVMGFTASGELYEPGAPQSFRRMARSCDAGETHKKEGCGHTARWATEDDVSTCGPDCLTCLREREDGEGADTRTPDHEWNPPKAVREARGREDWDTVLDSYFAHHLGKDDDCEVPASSVADHNSDDAQV